MVATVALVIGGVRSGKSGFAASLASRFAEDKAVRFIATARADASSHLSMRIDRHRSERPGHWRTIEAPLDIGDALLKPGDEAAAIADCLSVWISNIMLECGDSDAPGFEERARSGVENGLASLFAALRDSERPVVIVTNEAGCGVAPPTRLGAVFADLQGEVNQAVASRADIVWQVVAGIPNRIKAPG